MPTFNFRGVQGNSQSGLSASFTSNARNAFLPFFDRKLISSYAPAWWRRVAQDYLAISKSETPTYQTQELRDKQYIRLINQYAIEIGVDVYYAPFVHWGTSPHWMPRELLDKGFVTPAIFYGVAAHGARANPWMVRATARLEQKMPRYIEELFLTLSTELARSVAANPVKAE